MGRRNGYGKGKISWLSEWEDIAVKNWEHAMAKKDGLLMTYIGIKILWLKLWEDVLGKGMEIYI